MLDSQIRACYLGAGPFDLFDLGGGAPSIEVIAISSRSSLEAFPNDFVLDKSFFLSTLLKAIINLLFSLFLNFFDWGNLFDYLYSDKKKIKKYPLEGDFYAY